jgi:hypothetical protein
MALVYGLSRADLEHVLGTFPVVERMDLAEAGEFRTKRLVLEAFDSLQEAAAGGTPYESPLDPPPGDPSLMHPPLPEDQRPVKAAATPPSKALAKGQATLKAAQTRL